MNPEGKIIKVVLTGNAKDAYDKLNEEVGKEITKGITSSNNQTLFNSIKQKIDFLKYNPEYGKHISKNKIPKEYVITYDVNNLWKVNLSSAWRMIYTIRGQSEVEIINLVLDILDHKKYDKKFRYKKQ